MCSDPGHGVHHDIECLRTVVIQSQSILRAVRHPGADQVQPKTAALPNNSWYVSWFNNNPNDLPPHGYDVYYQMLNANGVEQFPHDGVQIAKLTLSSTQDYGLATRRQRQRFTGVPRRPFRIQCAGYCRQNESFRPAAVGSKRRPANQRFQFPRKSEDHRY